MNIMKKLFLLLFVASGIHLMACGGYIDQPKWSISVIGAGNYRTLLHDWNPQFLPGLQLNRKVGMGMEMRFGLEYTRYYNEPAETPYVDILYISGPEKQTTLRMGMEKQWKLSRWFIPYAAADLAGRKMTSDIHYEGGIAGMNESHEVTQYGIGILPAIGFKTQLAARVSFFAEYRAEYFVNRTTDKTTYYNGNIDSRPFTQTTADFAFGNIGHIGMQFSF